MKEQLDRTSPVSARVSIELPAERVNEHLNRYFTAVARQARIQGFRPGKAPVHVVKKMYGSEAASSIGERLISEGLMEVVRKHDLKLILPPTLVAVDAAKEDSPFRFEAELDLRPEVPSINFDKIKIEVPAKKDVTDEDVEKRLEEIRDHFAHHHPAPEGAIIGPNDLAIVKYEGKIDGERVEKACSERHELEFGKGAMLPEFETGLQGLKVGDNKVIASQFPEDHQVEEIRGKTIEVDVTILEVHARHRPSWDEENLMERVAPGAKTMDEVKSKIRSQMTAETDRNHQRQTRELLSNELVKQADFPVSPRQLQMATESIYNDRLQALHRMGVSPAELDKRKDEVLKFAKEAAEREIKLSYLLDQIGRDAKIEVTKEDLDKRFEEIAAQGGLSVADVKNFYLQKEEDGSSSRIDRLQMDLRDEKSLDYALSRVTIKIGSNS